MTKDNDDIKKVVLSCNHCGEEYTFKTLYYTTVSYGIFFLVGKTHGYMGIVCHKCFKTTLKKDKLSKIESIKNELNSVIGYDKGKNDSFRYHSFPYHRDYLKLPDQVLQTHCISNIGKNCYSAEDFKLHISRAGNSKWYTDGFRSYFWGDPSVGPAMTIWWFDEKDIKNFVSIENETGLKVFPRYIAYEPIYSSVERLCWEYNLKLDFLKKLNPLFAEKEKKAVSPKTKITKNYALLNVLDTSFYSSPNSSYDPSCVYFKNDKVSGITKRVRFNQQENNPNHETLNWHKHEHMKTLLWDNFNEATIQDLLYATADSFIDEYIQLTQKIDFSFKSVWDLKESFLERLFDSTISDHKRVTAMKQVTPELQKEVESAEKRFPGVKIISNDPKINQIKIELSKLSQINDCDLDILLLGESGTGKELFAKAIHEASGRKGKFIAVNCASIAEGLFENEFFGSKKGAYTGSVGDKKGYFEQAEKGTLFLDEIGDLDIKFQAKFLRVLQEREIVPLGGSSQKIDVKVVFATNKDIGEMVENGDFRSDLYERIKGFSFLIPPLRERKNDITILANHFIRKYDSTVKNRSKTQPLKIDDECIRLFEKYLWKGNVRELENVIKKIVIYRSINDNREPISLSDLPKDLSKTSDETRIGINNKVSRSKKVSDDQIIFWMNELQNNKSQVAKELNISYRTVLRRCKSLSL